LFGEAGPSEAASLFDDNRNGFFLLVSKDDLGF